MRFMLLCATGAIAAIGLQACDDDDRAQPVPVSAPTVGAAPMDGALGLSLAQLRDADLRGADGVDLGEVEDVILSATGAVEALAVEVENTTPDRFVRLPLAGLQAMAYGDDMDIQTTMTRDQLLALPAWSRPAGQAAGAAAVGTTTAP